MGCHGLTGRGLADVQRPVDRLQDAAEHEGTAADHEVAEEKK